MVKYFNTNPWVAQYAEMSVIPKWLTLPECSWLPRLSLAQVPGTLALFASPEFPKYVWVHGERRNYYLLCILDVYTRNIIDWMFQGSISQFDLINLLRRVNHFYQLQGVIPRNDNGSQFIANNVRNSLKNSDVKQQFTHIAPPQENYYIEAFHSILEREVIERNQFARYYEVKDTIQRFIKHYNESRLHRSIGFVTPQQKWDEAMVYDTTISEEVSNL